MPATLDGKLVVAISSRALFDFEAENEVFDAADDRAYMALQLSRLEQPAPPGVAYPLIKKLLAFNTPEAQRVEVVILSRNDPVSGMRVFASAQQHGLTIERAIRTLMAWNIEVDEAMFLGGLDKGPFLNEFEPDFFFDDQSGHCASAAQVAPAGQVLFGIKNQAAG